MKKGSHLTKESRNKQSETKKRLYAEGKIVPNRLGKHHTEESMKRMSISHKGQVPWNKGTKGVVKAWNKGKCWSEEARKNMSESHKGKKLSEEHKKNIQYSTKKAYQNPELRKKIGMKVSESIKNMPIETKERWLKHNREQPRGVLSPHYRGGGKVSRKRQRAKRRTLGFISLNLCFDGSEGHHIDKEHVIYIPKELHRSVWHSLNDLETMERINTKVFCWLLAV